MFTGQRGLRFAVRLILAGLAVLGLAVVGAALILRQSGLPLSGASLGLAPRLPMLALGLVVLLGFLAFLVGLILYVFLPTRSYLEAVRTYATYPTILGSLILALLFSQIVFLPIVLFTRVQAPSAAVPASPQLLVLNIIAVDLALLLVAYLRVIRPGIITWRDMGLTFDEFPHRFFIGIGTAVSMLIIAGIIAQVLSYFGVRQNQAELFAGIQGASVAQFVAVVLAGAVLAPFAEEIFFRGYIFTALYRERSAWQAYVFSSLLFGFVHLNLAASLPLVAIGALLAFVYHRTRSLVPVVVAHGLNNLLALSVLYFGPGVPGG